jgi:large subunit ribosomal protein L4
LQGNVVETITFDEACLGKAVYKTLLHQAIVTYEANQRQGTASTKTRREVVAHGAKPWRQKGTGRARVGTRTNPIWRGGGVVFGPKPRDFSKKMSKKARRNALKSALLAKLRDGEIKVVTEIAPAAPKTKEMATALKALGSDKSCLVVLKEGHENAWKSVRNIAGVDMTTLKEMNAYKTLQRKTILMTKDALVAIPEEIN